MVDHTGYSLHLKNRHHHVLPGSSAKAAGSTGECECVRGKGVVTFYIYILHLGHLADAFRFFRFVRRRRNNKEKLHHDHEGLTKN